MVKMKEEGKKEAEAMGASASLNEMLSGTEEPL